MRSSSKKVRSSLGKIYPAQSPSALGLNYDTILDGAEMLKHRFLRFQIEQDVEALERRVEILQKQAVHAQSMQRDH